jgi:hypothetical protein
MRQFRDILRLTSELEDTDTIVVSVGMMRTIEDALRVYRDICGMEIEEVINGNEHHNNTHTPAIVA